MKPLASCDQSVLAVSRPEAVWSAVGGRLGAYWALTKPRLVLLVLVTVAVGHHLGARGRAATATLVASLVGTALVAGGGGALNQWLERARDAQMRRTSGRPLPSGRLTGAEALAFGAALGAAGVLVLFLTTNLLATAIAAATLLLYVLVYTPLKPRTSLNTVVGAVPGALPPLIGWAAANGRLGAEAWALFLIMFLWQFPHFLAIAWIYRDDYRRGGYEMLTARDEHGWRTGLQAVSYAMALVPAGLLPATIGMAGPVYFLGALALGLYYLAASARFWRAATDAAARRLLYASFVYLPAVLLLMLINPIAV